MSFSKIDTLLVDGTPIYVWSSSMEHYFKGCDSVEVFTMAVQLYLKVCTDQELESLLDNQHFLRIRLYEEDKESRIQSMCLTLEGLLSEEYKQLLQSCPEDMIPCEILLGPFWHLLGINRVLCRRRNFGIGIVFPSLGYVVGSLLLGRDAYPYETEESIRKVEEEDEIFILRNK